MSIRVMSLVWEHSHQTEGSLLVLLAIADFADDSGRAYPSMETLAQKSRLTKRQVVRVVKRLVDSHELAVDKGGHGRGDVNVYRVLAKGDIENGDILSPNTSSKGDISDTKRVTSQDTRTVIEPSVVKDAAAAVDRTRVTRARAREAPGFKPLGALLKPPAATAAAASSNNLPDEVRERLAKPPINAHA